MAAATLVVVNYRSASLAIAAIASARAATNAELRVVVVDNSTDLREADALRGHADVLIESDRNLGYAAAINRARPHCEGGTMIAANPDVVFGPNSIDALIATDAAVAGPALYWDDRDEWLLPPAELHTAADVADRALASRVAAWRRRRDRRRVADRRAFWSLARTTPVRALSGAILAIRTRAFDEVGGFDERFPLYFEENDFLRRVKGRIVYMPEARCRHIYNQSAASSAEAASLYARSERAYLEKWSGRPAAAVLKRFERPLPAVTVNTIGDEPLTLPAGSYVEASPLPSFDTAAGHFPAGTSFSVPASIWTSYRAPVLYLRVVDGRSGDVLATYARAKIGS